MALRLSSSSQRCKAFFSSLLCKQYSVNSNVISYTVMQRKIIITQMECYGTHCEQIFRTKFNSSQVKCINWVQLNLSLSQRYRKF